MQLPKPEVKVVSENVFSMRACSRVGRPFETMPLANIADRIRRFPSHKIYSSEDSEKKFSSNFFVPEKVLDQHKVGHETKSRCPAIPDRLGIVSNKSFPGHEVEFSI
ncbi:unnamed protein product [Hermetia illucens]|uniref:Uncharacterized protein n=1 Tax=Hermetia illucens TaxID=343691 RepID=A0A7R8YNV0_HERIL|nr:unnamed protein product [Hermetia illucens]